MSLLSILLPFDFVKQDLEKTPERSVNQWYITAHLPAFYTPNFDTMKLFTPQQYEELLYQGANPDDDEKPVVNLIAPNQDFAWLLSEIYPHNPEVAF